MHSWKPGEKFLGCCYFLTEIGIKVFFLNEDGRRIRREEREESV